MSDMKEKRKHDPHIIFLSRATPAFARIIIHHAIKLNPAGLLLCLCITL